MENKIYERLLKEMNDVDDDPTVTLTKDALALLISHAVRDAVRDEFAALLRLGMVVKAPAKKPDEGVDITEFRDDVEFVAEVRKRLELRGDRLHWKPNKRAPAFMPHIRNGESVKGETVAIFKKRYRVEDIKKLLRGEANVGTR